MIDKSLTTAIPKTHSIWKGEGRLTIQFKKGVLEMCVLSLLQDGDRYGYDVACELSKTMEGAVKDVDGKITVTWHVNVTVPKVGLTAAQAVLTENLPRLEGQTFQDTYVDGSFTTTERTTGCSAFASLNGQQLTLYLFNPTNQPWTGDDGVVATFRLLLDGRSGSYRLNPTNVILSNATEENMTSATSGNYVIIQSPTIREVLPQIIAAVVEKDYMKIVTIVIGAFPKIKDEVVACLNK